MKIAFVGKGGSGKTTIAALFCRYLAANRRPVLAIDADINQHLAVALGMAAGEADRVPALGHEIEGIKDYLRGDNPRIPSASEMIKTSPPGRGSRLILVRGDNPLSDHFVRHIGGVAVMAVGPFQADDIGTRCYHSKTGAAELLLNHLIDDSEAHVVVDMTAGADAFASGLFTRFDLTVLVVEPTTRSLAVYDQYTGYAAEHGIAVAVLGNKVEDERDAAFIAAHVGDDLIATVTRSSFVRGLEKGAFPPSARSSRKMEPRSAACRLCWRAASRIGIAIRRRRPRSIFAMRQVGRTPPPGPISPRKWTRGFSLAAAVAGANGRSVMRAA